MNDLPWQVDPKPELPDDMTRRHVRNVRAMATLGAFIADVEKEVAWVYKMVVTGISCQKKEDGWLLVLKAEKAGTRWVLFSYGGSLLECYRNLWLTIHKMKPSWKPDKFKPKA